MLNCETIASILNSFQIITDYIYILSNIENKNITIIPTIEIK